MSQTFLHFESASISGREAPGNFGGVFCCFRDFKDVFVISHYKKRVNSFKLMLRHLRPCKVKCVLRHLRSCDTDMDLNLHWLKCLSMDLDLQARKCLSMDLNYIDSSASASYNVMEKRFARSPET